MRINREPVVQMPESEPLEFPDVGTSTENELGRIVLASRYKGLLAKILSKATGYAISQGLVQEMIDES